MSAMTLVVLLAAAAATGVGVAALYTTRDLRRQIVALRAELALSAAARQEAAVPPARTVPAAEIRAAVADALAEERERELAEARAFWAAQEARDVTGSSPAGEASTLLGELAGLADDPALDAQLDARLDAAVDAQPESQLYVPRQADFAGLEPMFGPEVLDPSGEVELEADVVESAELAAARRRHPSHPDFTPAPGITDHERTVARLAELTEAGTPLADVRPGPLGTLDVYVFADGTTMCMTPGHRETAERLAGALRAGTSPVLLGSSGVAGAYALTFRCGDENVYVLADRVIASL
ncbi:hypothetical protein LRS74_20115 [Streptomyces sp. LX-29]|uniref:hypothetical protein n=1 Tax=Streptomyces sp. LX-29 TaxID=2900152 RepID=UPI00240E69B0|nr:hypothetical protein [Streptomyces sp. LX-29]WFB09086.1 hypothetical protein LRS74_20115 [Streptomyces sp. LX-29]